MKKFRRTRKCVKSLDEYITLIVSDELQNHIEPNKDESHCIYRGHSQITPLKPQATHRLEQAMGTEGLSDAALMDYHLRVLDYFHHTGDISHQCTMGDLSTLYHRGVPTGILEFTHNALIALYDAISKDDDHDGIVYVLNTRSIENFKAIHFFKREAPENADDTDLHQLPIIHLYKCLRIWYEFNRNFIDKAIYMWDEIKATVTGSSTYLFGMDAIDASLCYPIIIKAEDKKTIRQQLTRLTGNHNKHTVADESPTMLNLPNAFMECLALLHQDDYDGTIQCAKGAMNGSTDKIAYQQFLAIAYYMMGHKEKALKYNDACYIPDAKYNHMGVYDRVIIERMDDTSMGSYGGYIQSMYDLQTTYYKFAVDYINLLKSVNEKYVKLMKYGIENDHKLLENLDKAVVDEFMDIFDDEYHDIYEMHESIDKVKKEHAKLDTLLASIDQD